MRSVATTARYDLPDLHGTLVDAPGEGARPQDPDSASPFRLAYADHSQGASRLAVPKGQDLWYCQSRAEEDINSGATVQSTIPRFVATLHRAPLRRLSQIWRRYARKERLERSALVSPEPAAFLCRLKRGSLQSHVL